MNKLCFLVNVNEEVMKLRKISSFSKPIISNDEITFKLKNVILIKKF